MAKIRGYCRARKIRGYCRARKIRGYCRARKIRGYCRARDIPGQPGESQDILGKTVTAYWISFQ